MQTTVLSFVLFLVCVCGLSAQECPKEDPTGPMIPSASLTIEGQLIYHNGIRQWMELHPDAEVCGSKSIEMIPDWKTDKEFDSKSRARDILRGCRATATGVLGIPGTGYYSASLYMLYATIKANPGCATKPPFPNYSHAKPDRNVSRYQVTMHVPYGQEKPVYAVIRSGDRTLTPWQAYASYFLTGGFALYTHCGDGFSVTSIRGTPEAKPWLIDGYAAMDPETAAEKGVRNMTFYYTCRRDRSR